MSSSSNNYLALHHHSKPLILAHHLSIDALPSLLDFVSPRDVEVLKNSPNLACPTVGHLVARFSSGSSTATSLDFLQTNTGWSKDFCAKLLSSCTDLVSGYSKRTSSSNNNSNSGNDSFKTLTQILNEQKGGVDHHKNGGMSAVGYEENSENKMFRRTGVDAIDDHIFSKNKRGFSHGHVSEIFGLPGCGKTQIVMQMAAVAAMIDTNINNNNNHDNNHCDSSTSCSLPFFKFPIVDPPEEQSFHKNSSRSRRKSFKSFQIFVPPILVIDTEGSWSNERVACFCEHLAKTSKNKNNNNNNNNVENLVAEALSRIQFIRTTDLTVACSAMILFREKILRQKREILRHLIISSNNTNDNNNNSSEYQLQSVVENNFGGLVIIDSITALMKENRINDNSIHRNTFLTSEFNNSTTTGNQQLNNNNSNSSSSATATTTANNFFVAAAANKDNLYNTSISVAKTQTISAFAHFLANIASETKSAIIVTNQMIKKTSTTVSSTSGGPNFLKSLNNNTNNSASNISYIPALGPDWARLPSVRVCIKRIGGNDFTCQERMFSLVRPAFHHNYHSLGDKNGSCQNKNENDDDDDEIRHGFGQRLRDLENKNADSAQAGNNCPFFIGKDFLYSTKEHENAIENHHDSTKKNGEKSASTTLPVVLEQQISENRNNSATPEFEILPHRRERNEIDNNNNDKNHHNITTSSNDLSMISTTQDGELKPKPKVSGFFFKKKQN